MRKLLAAFMAGTAAALEELWPPEPMPSPNDLRAEQLAEREAEEEVAEPVEYLSFTFPVEVAEPVEEETGTGGYVDQPDGRTAREFNEAHWADPYADAHPLTSMEIARLRLLLHDSESSFAPEATGAADETPGGGAQTPAAAGAANLTVDELDEISFALRTSAPANPGLRRHRLALADKVDPTK